MDSMRMAHPTWESSVSSTSSVTSACRPCVFRRGETRFNLSRLRTNGRFISANKRIPLLQSPASSLTTNALRISCPIMTQMCEVTRLDTAVGGDEEGITVSNSGYRLSQFGEVFTTKIFISSRHLVMLSFIPLSQVTDINSAPWWQQSMKHSKELRKWNNTNWSVDLFWKYSIEANLNEAKPLFFFAESHSKVMEEDANWDAPSNILIASSPKRHLFTEWKLPSSENAWR